MTDLSAVASSSAPPPSTTDAMRPDNIALSALRNWTSTTASANIAPAGPPTLVYDGKAAFTARSQYELPDGGRFFLLLSGSLPDPNTGACSNEPLTVMIEDDLGLPDGFLIDVNTYLFGTLPEVVSKKTTAEVVDIVLAHASKLYDKLALEIPTAKKSAAPVAQPLNTYHLKRRRATRIGFNEPIFGQSKLATTTLMKQLSLLQSQDTRKDGFTAEPSGDDLYIWTVKLFFDDTETTKIALDLINLPGHDCIQLEFRFPSEYPSVPPIVRVVAPYITGGHVAPHGGLCMELLTTSGWAPVNSIDAVCIQIRTLLVHGNARIDPAKMNRIGDYTFDGALHDLRAIVKIHHWNVADARRKRQKS